MVNRARYVFAIVSAMALAACAAPPAATSGTAADEAAVRAMGAKYAEAWNKGDVPAMVAMSTDDYESVSADGAHTKGRAANEELAKKEAAGRAGMGLKLTVETTYVRWLSANAATAGGTWTLAGIPAGAGADKGSWMATDVKGADGQWRMSNALVAPFVPPPAAPPAPTPAPAAKEKGK